MEIIYDMTLNLIGIGLSDEKDITVKGFELVKKSDIIYIEKYTSIMQIPVEKLEDFYKNKISILYREEIESKFQKVLNEAKDKNVSVLFPGDPLAATTHVQILKDAKDQNIKCNVIHNASIFTAIGSIGLELYKYGKTTSICFPDIYGKIFTHYDVIQKNKSIGLHTLCLLDIKIDKNDENRYMKVNEALQNLLDIENERNDNIIHRDMIVIGCARLGSNNQIIKSGPIKELLNFDFGGPLHSLIIPGDLHFIEEEMIEMWSK